MASNDRLKDRFVFRQGDTFYLGIQALDDANQAVDCTSVTVSAEVRTPGTELIDSPVVEWSDRAKGEFSLWGSGDALTTNWPVGDLLLVVRYASMEGARTFARSSKTLYLSIVRD
jgi:hypothetical protein